MDANETKNRVINEGSHKYMNYPEIMIGIGNIDTEPVTHDLS